MQWVVHRGIRACLLLLLGQSLAMAHDPDDPRPSARETLKAHLATMQSAERATLVYVQSTSLATSFKNVEFFSLRFQRYPVALTAVAPLKPNNVFAVVGTDITHIADQKQLEAFFRKMLTAELNDPLRIEATVSWLVLTQELNEDGFFEFEKPEVRLQGSSCHGELRVIDKRGDLGKLTVDIAFDGDGIADVEVGGKIVLGIRPKCQATRLLDADPVVREIMRQDILVMGKRCKPYLDGVKARAEAELRRAVEGVWQQILDEGR